MEGGADQLRKRLAVAGAMPFWVTWRGDGAVSAELPDAPSNLRWFSKTFLSSSCSSSIILDKFEYCVTYVSDT